jgi:ribosomal protein S18 acetylase RimI-like enzyme
MPFLKEILYEAVFWRDSADKPSFEAGLAYPEVHKALADWGKREGDTAVVAIMNSVPVGAAWYRCWTDSNSARGYLDDNTPEVVIAVHSDHRHQGVGTKLMEWLIDYASNHHIQKLSLSVSKDNHAMSLYRQQGFLEHIDKGDSFIMVRELQT